MNINPPLLFQDPNPLSATEAGLMYADPRPSPVKYVTPPCMDMSMWSRPCLVSRFSVVRDVGDSAIVFKSTVGPNEDLQISNLVESTHILSWKDIPLTFFRHINFKEEVIMEAVCPDEVKGRFAVHIWDYPTNRGFDYVKLRNRVEYWDLTETKRFSFLINPTANFYWKQRYSDNTKVDNRPLLHYYDEAGSSRTATFAAPFECNNNRELTEYGRWEVVMDQNLQIPPIYPETVDFLVWKRFVEVELYNAKPVMEGNRAYLATYE